jgi:hypothetical protein
MPVLATEPLKLITRLPKSMPFTVGATPLMRDGAAL